MSRFRIRPSVAGLTLGLLLVGFIGGWAVRTVLAKPDDVLDSPDYTLVEARRSTVGHAMRLNVSATWSGKAVAANQSAGTVTRVRLQDGVTVVAGQALYEVDLRPVVVADGDVPTFRELRRGMRGDDVVQLQEMLKASGHRVGVTNGVFSQSVENAVRAWQKRLGIETDGVVHLGDVLFVPSLPARLALDPKITVGAVLSGGEPAVQMLPNEPDFTIDLAENQAGIVSVGMAVEIKGGEATWYAEIAELNALDGGGRTTAVLKGRDGDTICGNACSSIPLGKETLFPSVVHVVPETSGIAVPTAALVADASGVTGVVLADGTFRQVTVGVSAGGLAIVDGLSVGEHVRTPGVLESGNRR